MPTFGSSMYDKFGAKYTIHSLVYAMWTVVPAIYNVFTAPHIQVSIIKWMSLPCYWRYVGNSMRLILQSWCQIQRISTSLRYLNCCPGHIQCSYISVYSGFSIQLNVSALLLEISRHFNARYTAILVPNTAHILQITLCELWSRPYAM
jgi:hypothetical protein